MPVSHTWYRCCTSGHCQSPFPSFQRNCRKGSVSVSCLFIQMLQEDQEAHESVALKEGILTLGLLYWICCSHLDTGSLSTCRCFYFQYPVFKFFSLSSFGEELLQQMESHCHGEAWFCASVITHPFGTVWDAHCWCTEFFKWLTELERRPHSLQQLRITSSFTLSIMLCSRGVLIKSSLFSHCN